MNGVFKLGARAHLPPAEELLRACFALGTPECRRPSITSRLEEALGPELAQRLVKTLTTGSRG